jgi:hypothetical protein
MPLKLHNVANIDDGAQSAGRGDYVQTTLAWKCRKYLSEPWHWGDVDNLENRPAAIMTNAISASVSRCKRTLAEVEATSL